MNEQTCLKCHELLQKVDKYGLHPICFQEWFKTEISEEFKGIVRRDIENLAAENKDYYKWNSSFFQGKFKKYSAQLAGQEYLLKIQQDIAPELPNVEYLCNQIAKVLGLFVPDFYLIDYYQERTFVTKNFIQQQKTPSRLEHVYHYIRKEQEYNCENLISIIGEKTQNFDDVELFIKVCLFDALIGNHDRHGRNLGFVITPKSIYLSPIYDNTSALGLESGSILAAEFDPKGKIYTKDSNEPTAKNYANEFIRLGHEELVETFIASINLDKLTKLISESFCTSLMKQALIKLLTRRYEEYQSVLRTRSQ